MIIALILLNIVFLVFNLAFNAQLLDLAASDITLIKFDEIARNGQLLSAFGMTLLAWKLLSTRFVGKKLAVTWLASFVLVYPCAYVIQDVVPDLIMENLEHKHKAASVYAYVVKKGYVSSVITLKDIEGFNKDRSGANKSLVANMGILLNYNSEYLKKIDKDFVAFTNYVFTRYWQRHSDELYEKFKARSIEPIKEIVEQYASEEAHRKSLPLSERKHHAPVPLSEPAFSDNAKTRPHVLLYARALPEGIRNKDSLIKDKQIQMMAKSVLGPLYVNGMNPLATKEEFNRYIPQISQNMAYEVAATDLDSEQGKAIIKNMLFLPFTLATSLFMGVISLVILLFSLIEAVSNRSNNSTKIKSFIIAFIVVAPLIIGNSVVNSAGFDDLLAKSGGTLDMVKFVVQWAMVTEGWLYEIKDVL